MSLFPLLSLFYLLLVRFPLFAQCKTLRPFQCPPQQFHVRVQTVNSMQGIRRILVHQQFFNDATDATAFSKINMPIAFCNRVHFIQHGQITQKNTNVWDARGGAVQLFHSFPHVFIFPVQIKQHAQLLQPFFVLRRHPGDRQF